MALCTSIVPKHPMTEHMEHTQLRLQASFTWHYMDRSGTAAHIGGRKVVHGGRHAAGTWTTAMCSGGSVPALWQTDCRAAPACLPGSGPYAAVGMSSRAHRAASSNPAVLALN